MFFYPNQILDSKKIKVFNISNDEENKDVISALNIYNNDQKIIFILNNSLENHSVYFDFGEVFSSMGFIKKDKIYMFYDIASGVIILKNGFDIIEHEKHNLNFDLAPNSIFLNKVFQFDGIKESLHINLKSLENVLNNISFYSKKHGINFESELFYDKNNLNLLNVIKNFIFKLKIDANFYYENNDKYADTFFSKIKEEGQNNFLFIMNTDNKDLDNFKFLRSDVFNYREDDIKKTFFVFEDLFSNEIFIRDAKELKKKGLAVKLEKGDAHFFRYKKVIDNDIMFLEILLEQTDYKAIKTNNFFKNIFESESNIVNIDDVLDSFMSKDNSGNLTWIDRNFPELKDKNIVYLCMEMFIPELYEMIDGTSYNGAVDANFSGGLGILAGCTMEGFSNIGLSSCAIIPMYRKRRVQRVNEKFEQEIYEEEIDYSKNKNIKKVLDNTTSMQLEVQVFLENKKYSVKIWETFRKNSKIFLLEEPEVFDVLYTGNREQRLKQEVIFGKVVPSLLKMMGIKPSIVHLNEAHPVIAAIGIKDWKNISLGDTFFDNTRILFTIHTPRIAGMEVFFVNYNKLEIPYYFKSIFDTKNTGKLDFTNAAIEISDRVNTVSHNQIRIVKTRIFTNEKFHRKIIGIMNGSSSSYWSSEDIKKFYFLDNREIKCSDIWNISNKNKKIAIDFIKNSFKRDNTLKILGIKDDIYNNLTVTKPSAWVVRRIVDYKNQWPLLKDIIRVICSDRGTFLDTPFGKLEGLGFQVIVGGMAHPNDHNSQQWIKEFLHWMKGLWRSDLSDDYVEAKELIGNFFFCPSSIDGLGKLLKMSAIGGDVCLEIPTWDEEACGTSGMRALGNSNICIDSSDGALEWLDDNKNSFLLRPYNDVTILKYMKKISQIFYNCLSKTSNNDLSLEDDEYLNMKKEAIFTWKNKLNIDIMAKRYSREMFFPTIKANAIINEK